MLPDGHPWSDKRVDSMIGNLLRAGVIVSSAIVIIGAVIFLFRHGMNAPHYRIFKGEPSDLCNASGIALWCMNVGSRAIIMLGFLVLIATPVARVALSVFAFAMQRDRMYVVVALIVLAILISSLTGVI